MILLSHRFRPPRKAENRKWETVKFLIEHGFYYQHIYEGEDYVPYPENLKDAKNFIEKYKSQARTINEAD